MKVFNGRTMARRERTYTPRIRTTRPLGSSLTSNSPPSTPIESPKLLDGQWYLPAPLSQRLHQKSGLGTLTRDGGVFLTPEEIMFCHWYRHVPLPQGDGWVSEQMEHDSSFLSKSIAMDIMRNGGEIVVPSVHLRQRFPNLPSATWAMRWERHLSWKKEQAFSQIRVHHTNDYLDWYELNQWVVDVIDQGQIPELCIMDDELDVTVYCLSHVWPEGNQQKLEHLSDSQNIEIQKLLNDGVASEDGHFISGEETWPLPAIGVPHLSGRYLRFEEFELLSGRPVTDSLYATLIHHGLLLRPGFKYGCQWRAYEKEIEAEHAPWLIQPIELAATSWEGVCLAVRLAEGVNKRWLCALRPQDEWMFLNIQRSVHSKS